MEIKQIQQADLIGLLLDANRVPNGWQAFLDKFKSRFNLLSCHLYIANIHTMTPKFQEFSGPQVSELELQIYMEKYFETDYTHLAILRGTPNTWYASNLMPNYDEIQKAPAFTEWAIPNGIKFVCGSTLFRDGDWSCVFVHNRAINQAPYTQHEIKQFEVFGPLIEKAVRLRLQLSSEKKTTSRLKSVLNHFNIPVTTLNEFGEIIAKNNLMDDFLKRQNSLYIESNSHLALSNKDKNRDLNLGITQTISSAKGRQLAYSNDVISIKNKSVKGFTIGFQELMDYENDTEFFEGALVFIISPQQSSSISPSKLISLFSLSGAEAQVAHLFSKCMSLKDISIHEGKSINTVREQIQTCFKKTKTKNQLELISLLSSLPSRELDDSKMRDIS